MGPPDLESIRDSLKAYALSLPLAEEAFPWGESAFKVKKKSFVFLNAQALADGVLILTLKLPISGEMALTLPYVTRAGYNLGRSGWVTLRIDASVTPDLDLWKGWIEQSYRAVAPKSILKQVDG
ncbi:MAG: MmcQ/YjbR family DNA-binding protein [Alphaproteobacteria bacterium]|nr:MmcQ/YjbR family DNA-binding protein [Alphaproteobacteria bacterium]